VPRVVVLGPDDAFRAPGMASLPVVLAQRQVFPDGEQLVVLPDPETLRGAHVLAVATTAFEQDRRLNTLFQLIETCTVWASRVDVAVPYLAYGRQDRRTPQGSALSATLPIRIATALGANRVLVVDRHSAPAAPGVLDVPAAAPLAKRLLELHLTADEVVATDRGGGARSAHLARLLGLPVRGLAKRKDSTGTYYDALPTTLRGQRVIVADDLCSTGSTLVPLLTGLAEIACTVVAIAVTHLLLDPAKLAARLPGQPVLVYTDTANGHPSAVPILPELVAAWLGLA
jgi:ribose-phosphate pyrophosphokinase